MHAPHPAPPAGQRQPHVDATEHFRRQVGPVEHPELTQCAPAIRNVGWTLGNACPYRCRHCYSMSARAKGRDLTPAMIDRVVGQLVDLGIETVNLGGNEPLFTNGPDPDSTLLPYIIHTLADAGILVGVTTSGITVTYLHRRHPDTFALLNDIDVSFDSPFPREHDASRGARLFAQAVKALRTCRNNEIPRSVIMCAMSWNFTPRHIQALVELARRHDAQVRINTLKPVEPDHLDVALAPDAFYAGFAQLMALCDPVEVSEPPLAALTGSASGHGCPCGRASFRIHSITPDGTIPVSPCVYLHDYKTGDLLVDDLTDIIASPQFAAFRRRAAHPEAIPGCDGCALITTCRGGCAARAYLHHAHATGRRSLFAPDPYCPRDKIPGQPLPPATGRVRNGPRLVHMDYLCTWIGEPRSSSPSVVLP